MSVEDRYGVEEKRYRLIMAELDKFRVCPEEFDAIEAGIAKGLNIHCAIVEALKLLSGGVYEPKTEELEKLRTACIKTLAIRELEESEVERQYEAYRQRLDESERKRAEEADTAEFFSGPEAKADFSYWGRKEKLFVEQAVALSLGKNPSVVNSETLKQLGRPSSPFVAAYRERLVSLERAIKEQHIKQPLTLEKLIEWAEVEGFGVPQELLNKGSQVSVDKNPEDFHHATMDVFYKVLVGMAIKHYQLDPKYDPEKDDTSDAFERMVADLHSVGATPITAKTIRENIKKGLKRGKERNIRYKKPPQMSTSVTT